MPTAIRPWEVPYAERFKNRKPRICVGFVAYGEIDPGVFMSAVAFGFYNGTHHADKFEISITTAVKKEQYRARNQLVMDAMQDHADFLIMLDDDHMLMDCPDMIVKFLEEEKPFQGGLYLQRAGHILNPVIMKYDPVTTRCDLLSMDEIPKESGPVDVLGGGVNWYDMHLFDFMSDRFYWPFPQDGRPVWFLPDQKYGLDVHFSLKIKQELGIDPWLNRGIEVGHVVTERQIIRVPGAVQNTRCRMCDMVYSGSLEVCPTCSERNIMYEKRAMDYAAFAHREAFRPAYSRLADTLCSKIEFTTALDVGAGQGFLVDALTRHNKSVIGVEKESTAAAFMSADAVGKIEFRDALTTPLGGPYDLLTCVEVAEHLPPADADKLVDVLTGAAKDKIFFTASEKDKDNPHHLNCQPREFWLDKFTERGWTENPDITSAIHDAMVETVAPWIGENAIFLERGTSHAG